MSVHVLDFQKNVGGVSFIHFWGLYIDLLTLQIPNSQILLIWSIRIMWMDVLFSCASHIIWMKIFFRCTSGTMFAEHLRRDAVSTTLLGRRSSRHRPDICSHFIISDCHYDHSPVDVGHLHKRASERRYVKVGSYARKFVRKLRDVGELFCKTCNYLAQDRNIIKRKSTFHLTA